MPSGVRTVGRPGEDEQPLLLAVLVVVRAERLAGRQLVEGRAGLLRPQLRAEAGHARAEALGIGGVVGELGI